MIRGGETLQSHPPFGEGNHTAADPTERELVLATKLVAPPIPPGMVERPRVTAKLDRAVERPVALIAAPAGAGKTALLASWAAAHEPRRPVAWLGLGPEANSRRGFWTEVIAAMERAGERLDGIAAPGRGRPGTFLSGFVAALESLPEPMVLILDDFHEVTDAAVMRDLDMLLDHASDRLHLVLVTRSDPSLRLQRLRIAGRLGEVRNADLAFTAGETRELLGALDLSIGDHDLELLWKRTEGWAAGLRLAALSLQDHPDPSGFIRGFAGDDRAVSDYLMSEMVSRQPADTLDFLLRTAVVEQLNGSLADALTQADGGQPRLEELVRRGVLVTPLDDQGLWFAYHPLLRELLRVELSRRMPRDRPELHARAGRWYGARDEVLPALRHAMLGQDWELAADVLGRHWLSLVARGEGAELLEVVDRIPAEVVAGHAELALALAGILLDAGEDARAGAFLTLAHGLARGLPPDRAHRFAVSATATDLYRARSRGHLRKALTAARAVLDDPWDRAVTADVRAFTLAQLGIAEFWAGNADAAADRLIAAAGHAAACGNDHVLLVAHSYGAAADVRRGNLPAGFKLARQALELAERRGWAGLPQTAMAHVTLAVTHLWWHELDDAELSADRAEAALAGSGDRLLPTTVALVRARLLLMRGESLPALEGLRAAFEAAPRPIPDFLSVSAALVEAELRLLLGEPERAWSVLAELETDGDAPDLAIGIAALELASGHPEAAVETVNAYLAAGRPPVLPFTTIEARVIESVARDCLNDAEGALNALERALDLAEPRGYADAVLHFGAPLKSLLRRRIRHGTRHRAFAGELLNTLEQGSPEDRPRGPVLLEPLSDRELAVLRFLPTMMSNSEIAAEMFVSVNTVKTHLKHVYRKLDVADRREAVRRGRELHLLSVGLGDR